MVATIDNATWPQSRLGEAIEAIARATRIVPADGRSAAPPVMTPPEHGAALDRWITTSASQLGLEAEATQAAYPDIPELIQRAGPALFRIHRHGRASFLAVASAEGDTVTVVGPDLQHHRASAATVRLALCESLEAAHRPDVDRLLDEAKVPRRRRERARRAILEDRLANNAIGSCWLLRPAPAAGILREVRLARLPRFLFGLLGAHFAQHVLLVLSWWILGRAALLGRVDRGWLLAWALIVATMIPLRLLAVWCQGRFSFGFGALLRRRLLVGALQMDPQQVRRQGSGRLLGQVMEAEAIEAMTLAGGFLSLTGAVEIVVSLGVLTLGPAAGMHALLLLAWLGALSVAAHRFYRRRRRWTDERVGLTLDMVEQMVGYRTRLAQESPEHWHDGEDAGVESYLHSSRGMDRIAAVYQAAAVRGWVLLGALALVPVLAAGTASVASTAIAVGGILLAGRALDKLAGGSTFLIDAAIGWRQVGPLYRSAGQPQATGRPDLAFAAERAATGSSTGVVLEAHDVAFRYRPDGDRVLERCDLSIQREDRILIEGPSGGGKSTLASLLYGLRTPEAGLLLLHGLDRASLGAGFWRRHVTAAPQFHENHTLTGSLAFNLLMGRNWPPEPEDVAEAEAICHELGLDTVLEKMPARLQQMVGETGWQLSHGEKSRLYIARTLLQGADVVILDESFAALDPTTLEQCLRCVLDRAPALVVIAHP